MQYIPTADPTHNDVTQFQFAISKPKYAQSTREVDRNGEALCERRRRCDVRISII